MKDIMISYANKRKDDCNSQEAWKVGKYSAGLKGRGVPDNEGNSVMG
jgi:hypothetical protein